MVKLERDDAVFVLRMAEGDNRMNRQWLDAMHSALDEVVAAEDPVALVTTGEDKFYSNGLDLDWLGTGEEEFREFVADVEVLLARVLGLPVITVAALNGHTFAAGALLALCHDFRVMRADRGFFCLPEVDLGIPFTAGMNSLVISRMPIVTAHEVMVSGRRYGGEQAQDLGIVDSSVAAELVLPRAIELAAELAGKDRTTLGSIKARMHAETIRLFEASEGTSRS